MRFARLLGILAWNQLESVTATEVWQPKHQAFEAPNSAKTLLRQVKKRRVVGQKEFAQGCETIGYTGVMRMV